MGASGRSRGTSYDSALSIQQAEIIRERSELFNQEFFPELYRLNQGGSSGNVAFLDQGAGAISSQTASQQSQVLQNMSSRGLSGSGFIGQGLEQVQGQRATSLAQLTQQSQQRQFDQSLQLQALNQGFAPQPSTAAPLGQTTRGRATGATSRILGFFQPHTQIGSQADG